MSFSALRPEVQVRLAVIAPLFGLILTIFVVYPAWGNHMQLRAAIAKQEQDLADLRAAPLPPPVSPSILVASEPSEAPQFLGQISEIAISANCRVIGFDLMPSAAPAPAAPATDTADTAAQEPKAPEPIKALRARIELNATYPAVREFLYRLANAPRPFTVVTMALSTPPATKNGPTGTVHAAVDIERYVVLPLPTG